MALDQITKALIEEFLSDAGLSPSSVEKDFEKFATHVLVGPQIDGAVDFGNVVAGDGGDTGIDAVAIVVNGELITDPDKIDELVGDGATLDVHYIFVQAKTSSSFSTKDIGQLGFGIVDFFSDNPRLARNEVVQAAADLSNKILQNARLFRNGNPSCMVYYVTAGRWADDPDLTARIQAAETDLDNLNLFNRASFVPVDSRAIQRRYHNLKIGTEREFTFQNRVPFPDLDEIAESHLGYLSAQTLLGILTDEDGGLATTVFYENVRDYQGDTNLVNAGMKETLAGESRNRFPLMNNGVTIIARGMRQTGTKFVIQDFQVVNGCQTCNVLWANREDLDEHVLVPLRLISTDNEEVIADIIKATNRQTEVKEEQFFATSDFLKKLEMYFETLDDIQRLHLERRSKQYANSNVERTRIVPFNSLVRAFASIVMEEPHRATRNYKQVLAMIPDQVLNPEHRPSVYAATSAALYRLEFLFRNSVLDRSLSSAKYHLLLASRLLIDPNPHPPLNSKQIDTWSKRLLDEYWDQGAAEKLFLRAAQDITDLASGDLSRDRVRTQPFTELVLAKYAQ